MEYKGLLNKAKPIFIVGTVLIILAAFCLMMMKIKTGHFVNSSYMIFLVLSLLFIAFLFLLIKR